MVIKFNGELFSIFTMTHRTPGNLRGFVQVKMRNLRNGSMNEHRFASEDKVEKAMMDEQKMEYMYKDGEFFYFMNTENYEQFPVTREKVADATLYLKENDLCQLVMYGDEVIGIELPLSVELTITSTDPGFKGDTATGGTKPATMETGLVVNVPLFVEEGQKIKINTDSGSYIERVS